MTVPHMCLYSRRSDAEDHSHIFRMSIEAEMVMTQKRTIFRFRDSGQRSTNLALFFCFYSAACDITASHLLTYLKIKISYGNWRSRAEENTNTHGLMLHNASVT